MRLPRVREGLLPRLRQGESRAPKASRQGGDPAITRGDAAGSDVLRVAGVSLSFGGVRALDNVSFAVPSPRVVGLIGANGAGKSTLLNCIAGRFRPQAGRVEFYGKDILAIPKNRILAAGITRTFQNLGLFKTMSVLDNLAMGLYNPAHGGMLAGSAWSFRASRRDRATKTAAEQVADRLGLTGVLQRRVSELPYGIQKRVELGRAIGSSPRLVLIDEPATGLSRAEVGSLQSLLVDLASGLEMSLLVVDHNFSFVTGVAQEIIFMDSGRIAATGTPAQIRENQMIREQYLGRLAHHD
jgi:branched-chain amino acid transport system ATP-binding protein